MARTKVPHKEKAEELLKSELKKGVRKGKITARQGDAIVNSRRSSRHTDSAAELVELGEHDEVRTARGGKANRRRTRNTTSALKNPRQIVAQAQTSKSAPRRRVASILEEAPSQRAKVHASRIRGSLHQNIEGAAPSIQKGSTNKRNADPLSKGVPRRLPRCSVCGVLQKEHTQPCDRGEIEAAAEEEAAGVTERARIESLRLQKTFLREGADNLASQSSTVGSTDDGSEHDDHSSSGQSPDVEMADDFFIEADESHPAIRLSSTGPPSDASLASDKNSGLTARGDTSHRLTRPHIIPHADTQTPICRSGSFHHSTTSTPISDRMSTSPQRPQSPPARPLPRQADSSKSAEASHKHHTSVPEDEGMDNHVDLEDDAGAMRKNKTVDDFGAGRAYSRARNCLDESDQRVVSLSTLSDSSEHERGDEQKHNDNDGEEDNDTSEDKEPAISEKQMRELAKRLAAGKVLNVAEARALRRALDQYGGPNRPNIDLFLLTKDVLQSKYHTKTYTQPMSGGVKATPNGAVELPLTRSTQRKAKNTTYADRKKHRHERFNAFALKASQSAGDALAAAEEDELWAFAFAVPKSGAGELREWTSPAVRTDAPRLSALLRRLIFDHLNPHREQAVREREEREESWQKELENTKALASAADQRNLILQEQIVTMQRDNARLLKIAEKRETERLEKRAARRAARDMKAQAMRREELAILDQIEQANAAREDRVRSRASH